VGYVIGGVGNSGNNLSSVECATFDPLDGTLTTTFSPTSLGPAGTLNNPRDAHRDCCGCALSCYYFIIRMSESSPGALCRSCNKRPGPPTAILGQLTQTDLCDTCAALRKARIRANRTAARRRKR
jgi:hypothetical protein